VIEGTQRFGISNSRDIDNALDELEGFSDKFLKVYYEPISIIREIDCEIEIELDDLDSNIDESSDSKEFEEEITTTEDTTIVTATVLIKEITKTVSWEVDLDVGGNKNCMVSDLSFEESYTNEIEQVEIEGDERAVPSRYKRMQDNELMSDEEITEKLLEDVYDRIASHIF